jgi:Fe-S-cluster-containing dehydrogenase component/DMSO reductase anchor subunit
VTNSSDAARYGMVVDINRCVGCQTCTISCKHANDTPPGVQWRKVLDVERGTFPDVERLFLVTGCQHCAEPSCVPVCPTGATAQRADGLVTMDYDLCIGCGYCAVACPYQARTIVHDKDWYYGEPTAQEIQVAHDDRIGVANKCTFCVERIDEAAVVGKAPGIDLDYTPACAASCIADALNFGDFMDPESKVSVLVRDNASFQMHEELGNDPQIRYLYEVPNATPGRDPDPRDLSDETLSDPANPLVGARQTLWDYRAAMNFILGGMSSGLAVAAYLAYLYGRADGDWLFPGMGVGGLHLLYLVAGIGMAVGLFFVFLEIARKLRFIYVLRRPNSSWMTRETYAVALFYPALLADLIWPHPVLHALVALSAAAFLYCQGRILQAGKGIPAWRTPMMPGMLVATGLYEGFGLFALISALFNPSLTVIVPEFIGLGLLAAVNFVLWRQYRLTAKARGIGPLARREIDAVTPYVHVIGHGLPIACLIASAIVGDSDVVVWLLAAAGAGAVVSGMLWKYTVITRACHEQGFAVPKMPQRGSGTRAAPVRLQSIHS